MEGDVLRNIDTGFLVDLQDRLLAKMPKQPQRTYVRMRVLYNRLEVEIYRKKMRNE
jgi:hypothetical protein